LDLPATNPFITIKGAAEKLGAAFTTAQMAVERLEKLGIVLQVGERRFPGMAGFHLRASREDWRNALTGRHGCDIPSVEARRYRGNDT